jgi:putative transposase
VRSTSWGGAPLRLAVARHAGWRTRAELGYEVITRIEHTYNRRRRQRTLGKLTPVEHELALTDRVDLAA